MQCIPKNRVLKQMNTADYVALLSSDQLPAETSKYVLVKVFK